MSQTPELSSHADLARRLRTGDPASLSALGDVFGGPVFTFFLRRGLSDADAAVAARASFVRCWRDRLNAPRRDEQLPGWVYGHAVAELPETLEADPLAGLPEASRNAFSLVKWQQVSPTLAAAALGSKPAEVTELLESDVVRQFDAPTPLADRELPASVQDQLFFDASDDTATKAAGRSRAWGLALVAVVVAAALFGSIALVQHFQRTSAASSAASTTTSGIEAQPSETTIEAATESPIDPEQLEQECKAQLPHSTGETLFNAERTAAMVHDAAGRVVVCVFAAGGVSVSAPAPGADFASMASGNQDLKVGAIGGLLPTGYDWAFVNRNQAVTNGRYWLWTENLQSGTKIPSSQFVVFQDSMQRAPDRTELVLGFGHDLILPSSGEALRQGCNGMTLDQYQLRSTLTGPKQVAGLLVYNAAAKGMHDMNIVCGDSASSSYARGVDPAKVEVVAPAPDVGVTSQALAITGPVPTGVTAIHITSPTSGDVAATIKDGYWIWDDLVDNQAMGLYPRTLMVRMTGSIVKTVPLAVGMPDVGNRFYNLRAGSDLQTACDRKAKGSAAVTSDGGHVVVLGGTTPKLCWAEKAGASDAKVTTGSADGVAVNDLPPLNSARSPLTAGLFTLETDVGTQFLAGGVVPTGARSISYSVGPTQWPATIRNGHFAAEFFVPSSTDKTTVVAIVTHSDGHIETLARNF